MFGLAVGACSKADYDEEEPTIVEKINKRAADEAVDYIQTPLNKARGVDDMADRHVQDLEEIE